MTRPLRVLFLGNHTVGVRALRVIAREASLVGIVAHPTDPEDGVRYESVFNEARRLNLPVIRAAGKAPELAAFIRTHAPDLLWITDYRYLLQREILALAALGAVNLHPSLLPAYRGRASINWAILKGEQRLGLSAHFVDEGMDTGDVIAQHAYHLEQTEDVGDALNRLYPLYESITAEVLAGLAKGNLIRRTQNVAQASAFPRRTPEDGRIDWRKPAREIWNLVRAVAAPYPGAFSAREDGSVVRLWKVSGLQPFSSRRQPDAGELLAVSEDRRTITIAGGDAALVVSQLTIEGQGARELSVGERFGQTLEAIVR